MNLAGGLSIRPFSLAPVRGGFYAVNTIVVVSPSIIVFSRPAYNRSTSNGTRLTHVVRHLGTRNELYVAVSRSVGFIATGFSRIVIVCRNHILLSNRAHRIFTRASALQHSFIAPPPIAQITRNTNLGRAIFSIPTFVGTVTRREGRHN